MAFRWGLLPLVLVIGVSIGCSNSSKSTKSSGQALSGTDEQIFIGDTVEKNYDPNVIMKRAESFFDKEDYAEAIIEYRRAITHAPVVARLPSRGGHDRPSERAPQD